MNHATTVMGIATTLAFTGVASADLVVNLGTVMQTSPRPAIVYTGAFGAHVTTRTDALGPRTITMFDLNGIANQLGGGLALVEVRVRDTGTNTYGTWSPGADIDLMRIVGADLLAGSVTSGYTGAVTQHMGESQTILQSRVSTCDAISGDQHFNSQHFISLGQNGISWTHFAGFVHGAGGSGGDGSGGQSGAGGWDGSGSSEPIYGGLLLTAGMKLEISEAGLGESYGVELVFAPAGVPAPGAISLLAAVGLFGRRRR